MNSDLAKMILYCLATSCSFSLAALRSEMFGDGTLNSPQLYFQWVCFSIGLLGANVTVLKSFNSNKSPENEPDKPAKQPSDDRKE